MWREQLSPLEKALVTTLLKPFAMAEDAVFLRVAYIVMAARQGHLCVKISAEGLDPPFDQVMEGEDLTAQIIAAQIPPGLVSEGPSTPLCCWGNLYYLQRHWVYETQIWRHLTRLMSMRPKKALHAFDPKGLLPQQEEAICRVLRSGFTLLTGGPGSGKTYTAAHLIRCFLGCDEPRIALTAPTGKAVSRLQAGLGRSLTEKVVSSTLHRLIGPALREGFEELLPLPYDLILVDEASMVDVRLMAYLFASVADGARLVLLGDRDQLPSVEAGSLFGDLAALEILQGHVARLGGSQRTSSSELHRLASGIAVGDADQVLGLLSQPDLQHITMSDFPGERPYPLYQSLWKEVQKAFYGGSADFSRLCILTPLRRGPWGADAINDFLIDRVRGSSFPIIIEVNDYRQELYNGEVGVMSGERAQFGERSFHKTLLPRYSAAFCLSVHKSQGSEFERVILLLPPGSEPFGREVLYTAVSRARSQLHIVGSRETIRGLLGRRSIRRSGLAERSRADRDVMPATAREGR